MENHSQGLLVKSVCAFHYQATTQPKVFTIQKFNRPLFLSLGSARLHFFLNTANVKAKLWFSASTLLLSFFESDISYFLTQSEDLSPFLSCISFWTQKMWRQMIYYKVFWLAFNVDDLQHKIGFVMDGLIHFFAYEVHMCILFFFLSFPLFFPETSRPRFFFREAQVWICVDPQKIKILSLVQWVSTVRPAGQIWPGRAFHPTPRM